MNTTRTANPNGTYTYTRDGKVIMKGSKSYYTHATTYDLGTVKYHKSLSAAEKATDKYQAKTGIFEIHEA
jgi:hypothetical protein